MQGTVATTIVLAHFLSQNPANSHWEVNSLCPQPQKSKQDFGLLGRIKYNGYDVVWLLSFSVYLSVPLSTLALGTPPPFYEEVQSSLHRERPRGKGQVKRKLRPNWQPLAITQVREPTFTWFQQPAFKSSARAPDNKEQRKTISSVFSLHVWHTGPRSKMNHCVVILLNLGVIYYVALKLETPCFFKKF